MLAQLSDGLGPQRSLLICCSAFRWDPSQIPEFPPPHDYLLEAVMELKQLEESRAIYHDLA